MNNIPNRDQAPDFLTAPDARAFEELTVAIAEDRWVLFVGSGVSSPSGVPTGQELVTVFNKKLGASFRPEDLPKATQQFEDKYCRADLIKALMDKIDGLGLQPNKTHDLLFRLRPKRIITTNVEQIIEKALKRAGLPYTVNIWNQDSGSASGIRLLKPHGDVEKPESFVFTLADYDAYPYDNNKLFIRRQIEADYAYESFLFIGYSADDQNFRALFQHVTQQRSAEGAGHYLITVDADDLKRKALARLGITAIDIGDYGNLSTFFEALSNCADSRRQPKMALATVDPSLSGKEETEARELIDEGFQPTADAIKASKFVSAEAKLLAFLKKIESLPKFKEPQHRDFHQRVLLNLATVSVRLGRLSDARSYFRRAEVVGAFSGIRLVQAAEVLLNLGHFDRAIKLLTPSPSSSPSSAASRVLAVAHLMNEAKQTLPDLDALEQTDDLDFLVQGIRLKLETSTEPEIGKLAELMQRAWEKAEKSPILRSLCFHLEEQLLRKIIFSEWIALGFDRLAFVKKLNSHCKEMLTANESLRDEAPEDYIAGLATGLSLYTFLDENEAAEALAARLKTTDHVSYSRLAVAHATHDNVDISAVDSLAGRGALSPFQRLWFKSQILFSQNNFEDAEREARRALEATDSKQEKSLVAELLIRCLLKLGSVPKATALLNELVFADNEFVAYMRAMILVHEDRTDEAIVLLESVAEKNPRDFIALSNLARLYRRELESKSEKLSKESSERYIKNGILQTERLSAILPAPEIRFLSAWYLKCQGTTLSERTALQRAETILQEVASEYPQRHVKLLLAQTKHSLGSYREAAEIVFSEPKFAADYDAAYWGGHCWIKAGETQKALSVWEKLTASPKADAELFHNLALAHLANASFRKAFEFAKAGIEKFPAHETYPALLIMIGQSSGDSKPVWEYLREKKVDLSKNQVIRTIPEAEALTLIQKDFEAAAQREKAYASGVLPFSVYERAAKRPVTFMWLAHLASGKPTPGSGFLTGFPRTMSRVRGKKDRQEIVLDKTSLLMMASLGVVEELIAAHSKANILLVVEKGTAEWASKEVLSLQVDQMPEYRARRRDLVALLRNSRERVVLLEGSTEPKTSAETKEAIGLLAWDLGAAIEKGGVYLDDFIPAKDIGDAEKPALIRSADVLNLLERTGAISATELSMVKASFASPFAEASTTQLQSMPLLVVLGELSLQAWYDSGLLKHCLDGRVGWPSKIGAGPLAWQSLQRQVTEADLYAESLLVAQQLNSALRKGIESGQIREITFKGSENIRVKPEVIALYAHELLLAKVAHDREIPVWTEDLATRLMLNYRGPLLDHVDFHALNNESLRVFSKADLWGIDDVLEQLVAKDALTRERHAEILLSAHERGYRCLRLEWPLMYRLKEHQYNFNAIRVQQLLDDLEALHQFTPTGLDAARYKQFVDSYLANVLAGLFVSVWQLPTSTAPDVQRLSLAREVMKRIDSTLHDSSDLAWQEFWAIIVIQLWLRDESKDGDLLASCLDFLLNDYKLSESRFRSLIEHIERKYIEAIRTWLEDPSADQYWRIIISRFLAPLLRPPATGYIRPKFLAFAGRAADMKIDVTNNSTVTFADGQKIEFPFTHDELEDAAASALGEVAEGKQPSNLKALSPLEAVVILAKGEAPKSVRLQFTVPLLAVLDRASGKARETLVAHFRQLFSNSDPFLLDTLGVFEQEGQPHGTFYRRYLQSVSYQFDLGVEPGMRCLRMVDWRDFTRWIGARILWPVEGLESYVQTLEVTDGSAPAGHDVVLDILGSISRVYGKGERFGADFAVLSSDQKQQLFEGLGKRIRSLDRFEGLRAFAAAIGWLNHDPDCSLTITGKATPLRDWLATQIESEINRFRCFSLSSMATSGTTRLDLTDLHAAVLRIALAGTASPIHIRSLEVMSASKTFDFEGTVLVNTLVASHRVCNLLSTGRMINASLEPSIRRIENELNTSSIRLHDFLQPALYGSGPEAFNHFITSLLALLFNVGCPETLAGSPKWLTPGIAEKLSRIANCDLNAAEKEIDAARESKMPNRLSCVLDFTPQHYAKSLITRILPS